MCGAGVVQEKAVTVTFFYSMSPNDSVPGMVVTAAKNIEVAKDNELFRLTLEGTVGRKVS